MSRIHQRYALAVLLALSGLVFVFFQQGLILSAHTSGASQVKAVPDIDVGQTNQQPPKLPPKVPETPGKDQADTPDQNPEKNDPVSANGQQVEKLTPEQEALAAAIAQLEPCSVINPITHGFIDLSYLSSVKNDGKSLSWTAKGYDAGLNFTLGVCTTPLRLLQIQKEDILDIETSAKTEVGAYFVDPKSQKYVSLGQVSTEPVFRGRKLTLTYTGGSFCPGMVDSKTGEKVRRSSVLSFTCDREMLGKASVSYVASLNDCSYFFEVRSHHACPTAAKADNLAVIWIFLLILLAALGVYGSGGLLYRHMRKQRAAAEK